MPNLKFKPPLLLGAAAMFGIAVTSSLAQELPEKLPTKADLAKDNKLFAELATKYLHWDEPTDPIHIVGPLYFVGTRGLSSWLFITSEGNILLNTGTPKSGPMLVESIRKLGFKPEDIKIIINGHGHSDHAGAFAYMKKISGAQIAIMQEDVAMIEDGGKSDFHYGKDWQIMGQPPVKVDRVLRDGDTVRLGEVVLTAYHTPGHTKGATTWVTTLIEEGKAYKVVFPDGGGFNPGYQIANPQEYPGINQDYRNTLHFLERLRPDIWGGHHTEYFDLEGKRKRAATEGVKAWVDPEGYRRFIASKRRAFEDEVDLEMGVKRNPRSKTIPKSSSVGIALVADRVVGNFLNPIKSMKTIAKFLKVTLVGGLLVVLPVWVSLLLLLKAIKGAMAMLLPIAKLLPQWLVHEKVAALVLLLVICFVVGLLIRTEPGRRFGNWLSRHILDRIPGFSLMRGMTRQLAGKKGEQSFQPALVEIEDALVPAFIIEKHADGQFTVFVSSSPTPMAGAIYILQPERVHPVDVPLRNAMVCVTKWGAGAAEMRAAMRSGNKEGRTK